ncbi:hypothetical protein NLJ89_g10261 [Agrocybe chaxingu]|uniref:Uncharacterized protein n=1 Tax=Agrocybe chaxingu TaxID=84603 RepID=A0A9W8JQX5_9AGAR|nr:hypothetical protein NLJ89_g10261 [Agrocybe chaxingu]
MVRLVAKVRAILETKIFTIVEVVVVEEEEEEDRSTPVLEMQDIHTKGRPSGVEIKGMPDPTEEVGTTEGVVLLDRRARCRRALGIVGLSIPDLGWTWGTIPSSSPVKTEETGNNANESVPSVIPVKKEALEEDKSSLLANPEPEKGSAEFKTEPAQDVPSTEAEIADVKPAPDANANPPPSRIRIYFHTPVTADDSRPIPHNASYGEVSSDTRKGKRKKTEDDDGDVDERRAPPPPPQMGISNDDRSSVAASVAPSVAETASEADWLMAAIVEGEEEAEAANALQSVEEDDQDAPHDHDAEHDMAEGGDDDAPHDVDETLFDGTSHDDDMTIVEGAEPDAFGSTVDVGDASAPASVAQELPLNGVGPTTVDGEHKTSPNDTLAEEQPVGDAECPQDASVSVAAPSSQSDALPFEPAANGSANLTVPVETQALQYSSQQSQTRSLQSISNQPTLLDVETQESTQPDRDQGDSTQIIQPEHLPEPPASPSTIAHEDSSSGPATKTDSKADKTPSANRLSISYARGNRRLVIDAEVVDYLKLYRQEGRIEVAIKITRDKQDTIKGVLMEGLSEVTKSYSPLLDAKDGSLESDPTVPPFWRTTIPSTVHLLVYLDTARPLSEPKWAKTGDVQDWLKSMFGRMFWVAGDAAEGWEKKIQVTDPDPPPTIWTVLDGWVANSPVGQLNERQRFLKTHMTDVDNILEILLRLVRGERATPFSQSTPTISAPSVSGPLLSAFQGSSHGAQQTHVSLAVLAMFRLTTEYATKASGDKGKVEAEERVGEIIRYLPSHLIYKSLDGIFKEWRVEKKGR